MCGVVTSTAPDYSVGMRVLVLAGWLFVVPLHAADTGYRIDHPDGSVEYTDQSGEAAKEIPLPEISTYPGEYSPSTGGSQPPPVSRPNETAREQGGEYTRFTVSTPQNDQTVWFDENGLTVVLQIEPVLAEGDITVVRIDGEIVASGTATSFRIKDVFRGTHTLSAAILDSQGIVAREADPILFHVRQHSRLHSQDPLN